MESLGLEEGGQQGKPAGARGGRREMRRVEGWGAFSSTITLTLTMKPKADNGQQSVGFMGYI